MLIQVLPPSVGFGGSTFIWPGSAEECSVIVSQSAAHGNHTGLSLLINTPIRTGPASGEGRWRSAAFGRRVPLITTLAGARAAVTGIRALSKNDEGEDALPLDVKPLQAYFE